MADVVRYAIDIAAEMSGGEQTSAELDALTRQLSGGGTNAEHFQRAMQHVSAELDSARAASASASAALAEGAAEYRQLERAAVNAGRAADRAARKNGGVVPPEYQARVEAADRAVAGYVGTLRRLEREAEQAGDAEERLARTHANLGKLQRHVNERLGESATRLSTFRGALGDVGGPVGELGERLLYPAQALVDLRERFGSTAAYATVAAVGIAAIAAAVVALTAAFVAGVAAAAAYAVRLADMRREADLTRQALEAAHPVLATVRGDIARLAGDTRVTESRLRDLARSLADAGVSAGELPAALRAAALAESALGEGGAQAFVDDIRAGKLAVADFAAAAQRDFGGIVARQMLGLEAQGARLKRNFGAIFGGLEIEGLLSAMARLVGLFDETSVVAKTIKYLFESIFQPLIDQASKAAVVVEAFAIGMLIGLTKVYIALKPTIKALADLFGIDDPTLGDTLDRAKEAGELFAKALLVVAAGAAVVVAAIGTVIAVVAAAGAATSVAVLRFIDLGVRAWGAIQKMVARIREALGSLDLGEMARDMMAGLVAGIRGAAGAVISAITGVVGGAIGAAKRALGIASPSKVFAAIGDNTGAGFVEGVEGMQGDAQSALASMVEPPEFGALATPSLVGAAAQGAQSAAAQGAQSSGARGGVDLQGVTFNFFGVEGAEDAERRFGETLLRILEGDVAQLGGAVPA